jgi:hypothetical protein
MTTVRIKGFKIFKDRHGRMRCYHRETGQKIDLVKAPLGSVAFFTECEKITAIAEANKAKAPKGANSKAPTPVMVMSLEMGRPSGPP